AWAGLLAIAGLGAWLARRRVPLLLPIALLFLPLLPVAAASLVEAGVRFAERSLALPVAGLALGFAAVATRAATAARSNGSSRTDLAGRAAVVARSNVAAAPA